jgi:hypothetical protein
VAEHLPMKDLPHITAPSGEKILKRIEFLAEVRNRALRPLDGPDSEFESAKALADTRFDKILFLNDIIFDPEDAAQLLFSTNQVKGTGRTDYRGACAVDFINPFKFYDTFATRDLDGYATGIPFYPWFTDAGHATTRNDVLNQRDAVRVRSCWGGMIAYEAKWFQAPLFSPNEGDIPAAFMLTPKAGSFRSAPVRFRAEPDTFWDASECCLVNADIQYPRDGDNPEGPSGIYMNPYVRVAYDPKTLSWLHLTRRPERLYFLVHNILNHAVGKPGKNPRRFTEPGSHVTEVVWKPDSQLAEGGRFEEVERVADPGRFCGSRKLLGLNEHPKEGESRWMRVDIPGCETNGGGCTVEAQA